MRTRKMLALFLVLGLLKWPLHEVPHVVAQGAAGLGDLPRGDQECMVKDLQAIDVMLDLASAASGKGGGSGGRGGSPMIPPGLIPRFIPNSTSIDASGGRKLRQEQGSSAHRDVDPIELGGCKSIDLDSDQALHILMADQAYQGPVPWVRDQKNCSTCVAHAFVTCVEASWAKTLLTHPRALPSKLSTTYPHYCGKVTGYQDCKSEQFIGQFATLISTDSNTSRPCLQMDDVPKFVDVPEACDDAHSRCSPDAAPGLNCALLQPLDQAHVQRLIKNFGAVVSPLTISDSRKFRRFFEQNPTGIWEDTSTCADDDKECQRWTYHHAVLLIGYNNTEGTYTALNSWGPGFANGGTFKIRQGLGLVGLPSSSYAVACSPSSARDSTTVRPRTALVVPLPDEPGFYNYTVNTTITSDVSALATLFDVSPGEVLRNNTPAPIPVVNVTYVGNAAAGECPSGPTCGSNQTSPICVLEVAHDEAAGTCTVTTQVPAAFDLDGSTLKVYIPESTFKTYKTAVPVCPAGQQPTDRGTCEACPVNSFKNTPGPQQCTPCASNSYQPKPSSTACLACPTQTAMAALLPAELDAAEGACVRRDTSVTKVPEKAQPASATAAAAEVEQPAAGSAESGTKSANNKDTDYVIYVGAAVALGVLGLLAYVVCRRFRPVAGR